MVQVTTNLSKEQDKALRGYMVEFDLRSKESAIKSLIDIYKDSIAVSIKKG